MKKISAMKKIYSKPEMQVYDMKPTSILCDSNNGQKRGAPGDYDGDFGYISSQPDELNHLA